MMTQTPLRQYRGSGTRYIDIAARGVEQMGLGVEYAVHLATGQGCIVLRFNVTSATGQYQPFTHFTERGKADYFRELESDGSYKAHTEMFRGVRLEKIALPIFSKAVKKSEIAETGDLLLTWETLAQWIAQQLEQEGFQLIDGVSVAAVIRSFFPAVPVDNTPVESVLALPNLAELQVAAKLYHQAHKPAPEPEDEDVDPGDEGDGDEEDEDDKPGKKHWN